MTHRRFLYLIAILLCTVSKAQQGGYRLDFELSKKDFIDTIAITYEKGRVIVPVVINGEQRHFLLDTGAGHAVVYDDSMIEGASPAGTIVSHDALGRKDSVTLVTLPPLTIGTLQLSGLQATIQHRPIKRGNFDGILGFDIVCKGLQMKIDTRAQQLVLSDKQKLYRQEKKGFFRRLQIPKDEGICLKYKLQLHVPYLDVEPFTGYHESVLFDTGSRNLYAMNKQHFDAAEQACKLQKQIEGRSLGRHAIGFSGVEPLGEVVFLAIDELRLGDFAFRNVHTLTTQGGSHLGARVLHYGAVVFDGQRRLLLFQPYEKTDGCLVGNRQIDKAIISEGGLPVAGLVWERSEAFTAGLRQGDVILKADNQPFRSFTDHLNFRPLIGHVYTFTVRDRRGFLKEVKMEW